MFRGYVSFGCYNVDHHFFSFFSCSALILCHADTLKTLNCLGTRGMFRPYSVYIFCVLARVCHTLYVIAYKTQAYHYTTAFCSGCEYPRFSNMSTIMLRFLMKWLQFKAKISKENSVFFVSQFVVRLIGISFLRNFHHCRLWWATDDFEFSCLISVWYWYFYSFSKVLINNVNKYVLLLKTIPIRSTIRQNDFPRFLFLT